MELALLAIGALIVGFVVGGGSLKKSAPAPSPSPQPIPPMPPVIGPPAPPIQPSNPITTAIPGQAYMLTIAIPVAVPSTGQPAIDDLAVAAGVAGMQSAVLPPWTSPRSGSLPMGSLTGTVVATWQGQPTDLASTFAAGVLPPYRIVSAGPVSG